jgi:hypothetical protein
MGDSFGSIKSKRPIIRHLSIFIPLPANQVVHQFASAKGLITVGTKVIHDRPRILEDWIAVPFCEPKTTGVVWIDSREQAGTRWAADGNVAVSLTK